MDQRHGGEHGISDEIIIYSHIDMFVSVCAPITATKADVEAFVNANVANCSPYEAVNKEEVGKKHGFDMGDETPSRCDQLPQRRLHWFLISARFL